MSLIIISSKCLVGRGMKDRRRTIPSKLKLVSGLSATRSKRRGRIKELSIQEEVIVELDKVNAVLEHSQGTDYEDHAIVVLDLRSDALYPRVNRWTGFTQIPRPPAA